MNNRKLIIPAAGKGSRLQSSAPKIFTKIDGQRSIYDYIIDQAEGFFNKISLILSPSGIDYMEQYVPIIPKNIEVLIQPVANGMFDAIDIALSGNSFKSPNEKIFIQWGDQPFIDLSLYKKLSDDLDRADAAIPLIWVQDPYVQFKFFEDRIKILESREGDKCDNFGFKDMGLFSFNENRLMEIWEAHKSSDSKGKKTNEKSFLKTLPLFSENSKIYWRVDQPSYKGLGINTSVELAECKIFIDQLRYI